MFVFRFCILLSLSIICLVSCQRSSPGNTFNHQVYIWQRNWTPSLDSSIVHSLSAFRIMHILVCETECGGIFLNVNPDYTFLIDHNVRIAPVFRINGQVSDSLWNPVIGHIAEVVKKIKEKNVSVEGIEIDYDCANSRLEKYAQVLKKVRQATSGEYVLSITALPCWMESPELSNVLKVVDYSVLQVHSVIGPRNGIFDVNLAFDYITRFDKLTPVPFRVSLPTYSSLIQFDDNGKPVSVENEIVRYMEHRETAQEYEADPLAVARLIKKLSKQAYRKCNGFTWFRLPVEEDKRTWRLPVLLAVVNNLKLLPDLEMILEKKDGITDLKVTNKGTLDAIIFSVTVKPVHCKIVEPLSCFTLEENVDKIIFKPQSPLKIRAGSTIPIGWMKCDSIKDVYIESK